MKINPIGNAQYSPAHKALYFTKTPTVMLDKSAEFMPHEIVSETKNGIRYLKDNDISKSIKRRLSEMPFIKNLAKKHETFVWFAESKSGSDLNSKCRSWVKISQYNKKADCLTTRYAIGSSEYGPITARENLFTNIKYKNFLVM